MLCLSNPLTRFFLLFGFGLTIGTTNAIAQAQAPSTKPVILKDCNVDLIDAVDLSSPVPGVLEFVTPEIGDEVSADEVIIGLQADVIKAQKAIAVKEAQNEVEKEYAKAAYELAEAEHRKALEANRRLAGTVAQLEVDRLKLAAERARLQIEQAQFQLDVAGLKAEEAEANVQVYLLESPISGTVVEKYKSRGEGVSQVEPILRVESTARLHVEGEIKVEDMVRVKRGDKVTVKINIPGLSLPEDKQELTGVVKLVDLKVGRIPGTVRVVAEVQNPDNILKAGLLTEMTIYPGTAKDIQTTQLNRK